METAGLDIFIKATFMVAVAVVVVNHSVEQLQ
jgi:hypothetical protein